jgi:hypothetical protein
MNAVLSLAAILIVSCVIALVFFMMAVGGGEEPKEEPGEVDPTDYSELEEEVYR